MYYGVCMLSSFSSQALGVTVAAAVGANKANRIWEIPISSSPSFLFSFCPKLVSLSRPCYEPFFMTTKKKEFTNNSQK